MLEKHFEQLKKTTFVIIFATLIFASWLHCVATSSNFWLQRTLENFLRESQTFPRYVTSSPNWELSNGTKIITCGSLEKNRHAYFEKRYPHLPFVSYFSLSKFEKNISDFSHKNSTIFHKWLFSLDSIFCATYIWNETFHYLKIHQESKK